MTDQSRLWTVRSCLRQFRHKFSSREKIVFPDESPEVRWTGADFVDTIERVSNGYLVLGIEKGDRVGLIGLNTPAFVVSYYAAMHCGAVPCIFNPRESSGRLEILGQRFQPSAMVYDPRSVAEVEAITKRIVPDVFVSLGDCGGRLLDRHPTKRFETYDDVSSTGEDGHATVVERSDPAFVNWSTGTTGIPKGLVWTHEGAVAAGMIHSRACGVDSTDTRVNYSTPGFIGWFYANFPNIVAGATSIFMEHFDPARYLELVETERATDFGGVSTTIRMTLEACPEEYDLSSVASAFYVGEPMDLETIDRIRESITPNVYALYGTTEAAALSGRRIETCDPRDMADDVPLVEARVVELQQGDRKPSPADVVTVGDRGELILKTPARAERIIADQELTDEVFRDGWWYSGDVARVNPEGTLRIVGRVDDMIVSGGINVFPTLVEDVLADHAAVTDVAVLGLPHETWGERVVAVVQSETEVDVDSLDAFCRRDDRLPNHARPREYFVRSSDEELPVTATGKISRDALSEQLQRLDGTAPRDRSTERT